MSSTIPVVEMENRIEYKLALLVYRIAVSDLHGLAPPYTSPTNCMPVSTLFTHSDDCDQQPPTLFGSSFRRLVFPKVGDRAFSIAAARVWNSLPVSITAYRGYQFIGSSDVKLESFHSFTNNLQANLNNLCPSYGAKLHVNYVSCCEQHVC